MKDNKIGLVVLFGFLVVVSVILMFVSFPLGLTVLVISSGFLGILLFVYFFLAPKNIFFTFIGEGTAKMVVRGGKFRKALIQWKGYTLDGDGAVISTKAEEYHLFGGLRFYGLWPLDQIYTYHFEWTGLKTDGSPLPHPKELLDYILLKQDVYFAKTEEAEDKERLPLDVSFVLTISIINPYNALFKVQNWLEAVISRTIPTVRKAVSGDVYANLIANLGDISKEIHTRLAGDLFTEFRDGYGVDVLKLEIQKIDPPAEQREATLKEYNAKQEYLRIKIGAEAEAKAIEIVFGKIQEFGELGTMMRTLETIQKSGAKWIFSIPSIDKILSKIPDQIK